MATVLALLSRVILVVSGRGESVWRAHLTIADPYTGTFVGEWCE